MEIASTALRAALVYVFVLVVMRVLGKRTVGNITALDLVVAFIISEVVSEPLYGQASLGEAAVIVAVVAGMHFASSLLGYHFPKFDELVGGKPNVLIHDGQMRQNAMRSERINEEELRGMLREHQIERLEDVKLGVLETNGQLSVITKD
jgi:uncharacterized membrane protein YcaP (DUF421 family)